MRFFKHKPRTENAPLAGGAQTVISAEADVRRAISHGAERRRPRADGFSVLCVVPRVLHEAVTAAETEVATSTIARELRGADQFCLLDDASYVILLPDTDDWHALVVAQRLAVALTLRMAALVGRKWHVGVAGYPHDARTEAALIEFAHAAALDKAA